MSGLALGLHTTCQPVEGPKAYEVRSGSRYLQSLEDGEIRSWPDYHFILIDERTGHLMIEGGYGTFSYGWPAYGRGKVSLHAFLYDLHFDYFMGKAARQPYRVADFDATVHALQREILSDRRCRFLDRREARELWDDLDEARADNDCDGMVRRLYDDSAWSARLDCSDPSVMRDHPGMVRFWDEVWRPFCEEVLRPHWIAHREQQAQEKAA